MTYEYIVVSHMSQCNRGPKGVNKLGVDQPGCHSNKMEPYTENTAGNVSDGHSLGSSRGI